MRLRNGMESECADLVVYIFVKVFVVAAVVLVVISVVIAGMFQS